MTMVVYHMTAVGVSHDCVVPREMETWLTAVTQRQKWTNPYYGLKYFWSPIDKMPTANICHTT